MMQGGKRELNGTQVAPTWRAVAQEIRFLFSFVTLGVLVSSSAEFSITPCAHATLHLSRSHTAY